LKWAAPGKEELPDGGIRPVRTDFNCSQASVGTRKRFFVKDAAKREAVAEWAARNKFDTLVFSSSEKKLWAQSRPAANSIKKYELFVEAGMDISSLLPRKLFLFNRDLFRMEEGKRTADFNFCPTNPKTSARVRAQAISLFSKMKGMSKPMVFHLTMKNEKAWCSCPACRAFSLREQYLIAVNTVADALAGVYPDALLSYQEAQPDSEEPAGITPRKNTFAISPNAFCGCSTKA
jgi:hypothetical protein